MNFGQAGKRSVRFSYASKEIGNEMSITGILVLSVSVAAQGAPRAEGGLKVKTFADWQPPGALLGFTGKGDRPFALEQVVPGVQGALQLTEEQKRKIAVAMDETIYSEGVRAAMVALKKDASATETRKDEARKLVEEARSKLQQVVGETLTGEQKSLVERIDALVKEVRKEVRDSVQAELGKGNPELEEQVRERVRAAVPPRLAGLLSPDQLAAFEKAAAAQIAVEKAASEKPKGRAKPDGSK